MWSSKSRCRIVDVTVMRTLVAATLACGLQACSEPSDAVLAEITKKAEQNVSVQEAAEKETAEKEAAKKAAAEREAAQKAAAVEPAPSTAQEPPDASATSGDAADATNADDPDGDTKGETNGSGASSSKSHSSSSNGSSSKADTPSEPAEIPEKRSDKDFLAGLKKIDAAGACKKHVEGAIEARLTIVVDANGTVTHTRAKPPVHGTPLGDCLEETLKNGQFTAAQALQMHWHTYKFLADGSDADATSKSSSSNSTKKKPAGPSAAEGKPIFMKKCKTCHGADGAGKTSLGEKLGIPSLKKTKASKISKVITNGVSGTKMKSFKSTLSAEEIAAVAAFVKSL